ncbi:hypothetical protein GCM10010363_74920 [Streptomyces omiyaensis]|nr:hypothetical protein GCM10010363_74920 [Streptomyces omiyaensis]
MRGRDTASVVARYKTLPSAQRRSIARSASPELRAELVRAERQLAMDRSPGALAAVLTGGREMQAPHLDLIDQAFIDMAEAGATASCSPCPRGTARADAPPTGPRCGTSGATPATA